MTKLKTVLYWLWSCTWGCIMTAIGAVVALVLIICNQKPRIFHHNVYFQFGRAWGGVNFGAFFFLSSGSPDSVKQHEAGHGLQNLIYGPLMPFVVAIPSAFRCLLRDCTYTGKKIVAGVITSVCAALGIAAAVCGLVHGIIALTVIGALIAIYAGIIAIWAFKREIPQYAGGAYVPYDNIWFEADATRRGETAFPL